MTPVCSKLGLSEIRTAGRSWLDKGGYNGPLQLLC